MLKEYLTRIANAFRRVLDTSEKINAQDFPDKVSEVYEKSRLDVWNEITNNNTRKFYTYAYREMPDGTFNPPFAVKPRNAEGMFHSCKIKKITSEQLDLSACSNFPFGFASSQIEELGIIDLRKNGNNASVFLNTTSLRTVEKVILKDEGQNLGNAFNGASALTNVEIVGKISATVQFSHSPLTLDSAKSVFDALMDYSGTTSTYTVTLSSTTKGYLSESDIAIATQKGWTVA